MDFLLPEAGAFYIMDRAYLDFEHLHRLHLCGSFFVLRNKSNTKTYQLKSNPVDRSAGGICDQIVKLGGISSKKTGFLNKCEESNTVTRKQGKYLCFW